MESAADRARSLGLVRVLIGDVIAARARLDAADTQSARRDVIRASLAAMEGEVWLMRDHVRKSLDDFDELTPLADLALREQVYAISENGELLVQPRSVPLPTAIRFVASQARIICPDLAVEYSGRGWASLKRSVAIRNRITHPNPLHDLDVSDDDLDTVNSGLLWLIATADYILASTNLALTELRDLLGRLLAGDPAALAEYDAALGREG